MDTLNSNKSGTIKKSDFKKALLTFNLENQAVLDIDSIVSDVFKDQVSLDRSEIRNEMSSNPTIQDSVQSSYPMINSVLKQLESSASSNITKTEVVKAIKDAAKENHIVLAAPQVAAAMKSIFNQADLSNSGTIRRSKLREAVTSNISEFKDLIS
jgi:Ca2+-binding EF-hand superfamily protein